MGPSTTKTQAPPYEYVYALGESPGTKEPIHNLQACFKQLPSSEGQVCMFLDILCIYSLVTLLFLLWNHTTLQLI